MIELVLVLVLLLVLFLPRTRENFQERQKNPLEMLREAFTD